MGENLAILFSQYLQRQDIQLTASQERLCAIIIDTAQRDAEIGELLTEPAAGASFVFDVIDGFCTSRKMLDFE